MRSRTDWIRRTRVSLLATAACVAVIAGSSQRAFAELRKFAVMLAHSPKSHLDDAGRPGLPEGGLHSVQDIRERYFGEDIEEFDTFAEYWSEISYGDVVITGEAFQWVRLPWVFEPNGPNHDPRPSPVDFVNLYGNRAQACALLTNPPVPSPYAYGAGEEFCDCFGSGDVNPTPITAGLCGALIIRDFTGTDGEDTGELPPPPRHAGLDDSINAGVAVYTPGERFLDLDGDQRWDGLDELNDRICMDPNVGCGTAVGVCRRDFSDNDSFSMFGRLDSLVPCEIGPNAVCPGEEVCVPTGPGPVGCGTDGCGDLAMPAIDWDDDDDFSNPQDCLLEFSVTGANQFTGMKRCNPDLTDPETGFNIGCTPPTGWQSDYPICIDGHCVPEDCRPPGTETPRECCTGSETDPEDCIPLDEAVPGINCTTPDVQVIECCEFHDFHDDEGEPAFLEPFEDYMVRWNPLSASHESAWIRVSDKYVGDNYPGDAEAVVRRSGNGVYDPPDLFVDAGSTKMMQDAGQNQFGWITPKPGRVYAAGAPNFEQPWFEEFWSDRYSVCRLASDPGTVSIPVTPCDTADNCPPGDDYVCAADAPLWPFDDLAESGVFVPNSPVMRPFDPEEPNPPIVENEDETVNRRWFQASGGGFDGRGEGTLDAQTAPFNLGDDNWTSFGEVEPDTSFGYYDGWVEHDDLASSRYHRSGDKRLGEITAPSTDTTTYPPTTGEEYTAIAGADLGRNSPESIGTPDTFSVAAGPMAVNIHGSNGFDAGDVCILEWLTWRTDGTSPTPGLAWEFENGPYHPYAGAFNARTEGAKGFADYNLDGMIDQGEVRPELSENYSVDSVPGTPNDGSSSVYPFNRRRMVEDVVEALDANVDWDDFNDPNRNNTVSGIVLVPSDSYTDVNRFPRAPSFYPIHTEDTAFKPGFHDLVICQDCRDFPAAVGYAAHEYLHTWEGYPDLYDYDVFDDAATVNCPVGLFDIMAGSRGQSALVHPVPPLKEFLSGWVQAVDFATLLTPGVVTTLTLPPAELVRNNSYYFIENTEQPGERLYFWSAGSGLDEERFPDQGLLILQVTDVTANNEAITLQQRTTPANFRIIQADGLGELEACSSSGNRGDAGDMWPGSTDATQFNFDTTPAAVWTTQNRWTGINIRNIEPDGNGSVKLTLSWTPTNIPSLTFLDPPGGESVSGMYPVRFRATDVFGGTEIELYYTQDPTDLSIDGNLVNANLKGTPGTIEDSLDWNVSDIPDGRYHIFAKLIPGPGLDGTEDKFTRPRAQRGNVGDGDLEVVNVDVSDDPTSTARTETWTATYVDPGSDPFWVVYSSLTQPEPDDPIPGPFTHAQTCPKDTSDAVCAQSFLYRSLNGEVEFYIKEGDVPFTDGDGFNFTTTGITKPSVAVAVKEGRIRITPTAVITASPVTIRAGETVDFNATESIDPQDRPLEFEWNFGDGSTATGEVVSHRYQQAGRFTVTLTVTNTDDLIGDDQVNIIVSNHRPVAAFTVTPNSGPAPLAVTANAQGSSDFETDTADLVFQWDLGNGTTLNDQEDPGTFFQTAEVTYEECTSTADCMAATNPDACPDCTEASPCACTAQCQCAFTITLTVTDDNDPQKSAQAGRVVRVGNTNPIASATQSSTGGNAPLTVIFNASDSADADGDTLTVDWDFGDGTTLTDHPITGDADPGDGSVAHTYAEGNWLPGAVVKDGNGGEDAWEGNAIEVQPPLPTNTPPTAAFTVDPSSNLGLPGDIFTFDASASTDPEQEQDTLIFRWAFGDGTFGTGVETTHSYALVDDYQVELTVTDERGATDSATETISIIPPENRPPTAVIATGPRTGVAPALLTFDGRNSFDPDDDPLTYAWEVRAAGELIDTGTGAVLSQDFENAGTFSVLLEVNDGRGEDNSTDRSDPVTVTITEPLTPPDDDDDDDDPETQPIPDSADQRPDAGNICGLGMVTGLFGSFLGLSLLLVGRRRRRG